MRFHLALALAVGSTLTATSAFADDAPTKPVDKPAMESSWYGYQTLAVDGAAIAVGVAGTVQKSSLPAVGVATYAIGAPIVHIVHGHGIKALGSLGLRVGAPVVCLLAGGLIAGIAAPRSDAIDGFSNIYYGMVYGGLTGFGAAMAIDAAFLAREDVPKKADAAPPPPPAPAVAWTPTVTPSPSGVTAGVAGTF